MEEYKTQNTLHLFENTIYTGVPVEKADKAIIMIHGRGDSTEKMKQLATELGLGNSLSLVFPKATNNTWYPKGFMAPTTENEPWLTSALENLQNVVAHLKAKGIKEENIYLLGFSQGACLTLEYATIHAKKYAGIFILSGGLIGPEIDLSKYKGDFKETKVLIGCSDIDHHVPLSRLKESKTVITGMGADLDYRIYPNMDHIINEDEKQAILSIINVT